MSMSNNIYVSQSFVAKIQEIVNEGRRMAYSAVSAAMLATYWQIGKCIVEEEQQGDGRAAYGKALIDVLADTLTQEYGKGYSPRYLRAFRQFYILIPDYEIWKSRFPNLTWTHVFRTLRVADPNAIRWYLEQASKEMWSVRVLNRNISTQYYERHLSLPSCEDITRSESIPEPEGDNPTIGIVLCSETDEDIARYSILKGNEQIFASKYKSYLPSEEQLRDEIERQKQLFRIQHECPELM